jgi:hypothetical protein
VGGDAPGIPTRDINQMVMESQMKEAAAKIKAGAPPQEFGLPAQAMSWGVAVVPDAGLAILTLQTIHGPLSFSFRQEQLEDENGILAGLQQALTQARSGLVVPNGPVDQPG